MGSKLERQNQHTRRLTSKIKKFKAKGKSTAGLERELGYMQGGERPARNTGRDADPRYKKGSQSD
jgi:hypothetical protein